MNESDRKKNRINCMYELYVWNRVNEWLDFMDSPNGDWREWMNRKQKQIDFLESQQIGSILSDCM